MIKITTDISEDDIMDSLTQNSQKDILKFILRLDSSCQCYEFTTELIKELIKSLKHEFESAVEPFNVSEILPDGFKVTSTGNIKRK